MIALTVMLCVVLQLE